MDNDNGFATTFMVLALMGLVWVIAYAAGRSVGELEHNQRVLMVTFGKRRTNADRADGGHNAEEKKEEKEAATA
jgi:hypothetical protein